MEPLTTSCLEHGAFYSLSPSRLWHPLTWSMAPVTVYLPPVYDILLHAAWSLGNSLSPSRIWHPPTCIMERLTVYLPPVCEKNIPAQNTPKSFRKYIKLHFQNIMKENAPLRCTIFYILLYSSACVSVSHIIQYVFPMSSEILKIYINILTNKYSQLLLLLLLLLLELSFWYAKLRSKHMDHFAFSYKIRGYVETRGYYQGPQHFSMGTWKIK